MSMHAYLWLSVFFFVVALLTSRNRTRNRSMLFLGALGIFSYIVLTGAYVVADYFTGEGINDAVMYHLRYGLEGTGFGDYYLIILVGFGFFLASFIMAYFYYRLIRNDFFPEPKRVRRIISSASLFLAFALNPTPMTFYDDAGEMVGIEDELREQNKFSEYYKTPSIQSLSDEHPNLVYIFAESFETTYFDETLFPSLAENLKEFQPQSVNFTDIRQVKGTSWTIAGATAVLCGIPLVTPTSSTKLSQGNSMSQMSAFYSGATCMSDLLHKEGYKITSRRGASLKFAGTDKLYRTHGFEEIKGLDELKPGLKNPSYVNAWGLYDDTLFDIAFNDFKKLSASKRKFALFVSTMDTHHPSGHLSQSCEHRSYQDGRNDILNTVYCSDELIAKLIKKIQDSPYGKNTVIVVASDHLAMHNTAIDTLSKGTRRDQFMIIDPRLKEGQTVGKTGSTLDIAPTLLPFLGYKLELGLGRNLLGEERSLVERFEDFDDQLDAWTQDISKFWEFPKIEHDIVLDAKNNGVKISKSFYPFPILLRINEGMEINPFFEVQIKQFETPKLFTYLKEFRSNESFLWVDSCARIHALESNETNSAKAKYCYALGSLGGEIKSEALSGAKTISLEQIKRSLEHNASEEIAQGHKEVLGQLQ